jgi:tripartite-type tricarboxylate transporter receptor subunit TctC
MICSRREWLMAAAALAACSRRQTVTGCASLRGKSIRWIVPFGDGGSYEIYSRALEPFFEQALGAEIVIAIEPGNGGIVGATKLRDALPNGRTVGILNAPGLFAAAFAEHSGPPNPARDFAILGRLGRSRPVLAVAASSPITSMEYLLDLQKTRPLVCGASGFGSNSLLVFAVSESLLGLRFDYVVGYNGSRDVTLAVLRGDVDFIGTSIDSVQQAVNGGDLRVLLQIADGPIGVDPSLRTVAWIGGPQGWAQRRALELGRDPALAVSDAHALVELTGAGVVAAAPRGLPGDLLSCTRTYFHEAATSRGFQSAAQAALRTPDVATGEEVQAQLLAAEQHVSRFAPIVRKAFSRVRH